MLVDTSAQRCNEEGTAVDRKHPHRGLAGEGHVMIFKGLKRGKEDLDAPACDAAFQKIVECIFKYVFHKGSSLFLDGT